jgi:hypothetical protein
VRLQNVESLDTYINYWVRFIYYSLRVQVVQRKIEARGERSGSRDKESRDDGDGRSEGSEGDNSDVSEESGSETGREVRPEEEEVGGSERFGS